MKKLTILLLLTVTPLIVSCTNIISNPDIQTLNKKAADLMNSGDVKGAISRLESINDLNPDFFQNHYNLGVAYYRIEEYEKAIESLKRAINLNKKAGDAYYTIGLAYYEKALLNIEKLEDESNNNKKKSAEKEINYGYEETPLTETELLTVLIDNLNNSKEYFTQYISMINETEETEKIDRELENIDEDLKKYTEKLSFTSKSDKG